MSARRSPLGADGACSECGQPHLRNGRVTCAGHVTKDRDSYVPGQPRADLPAPRPCRNDPAKGLDVCKSHGAGNPAAREAGKQRDTEAKAHAAVIRKLGDAGETVTDPIGKLCAIAGRAVAFMETLGDRVDQLEAGADRDQTRADIAVYGRSIKDAAQIVESIIRMGIAERFAKQNAEAVAAYVTCLDAIITDLGHNPRDPHVAGVIARRLELVQPA